MEPQIPLECDSYLPSGNLVTENGGASASTSLQINDEQHKHVKKQTRQWAAWTHEEEENFFSALRQVGKNFEKITSRVQSKNKDQVRHYYYRLVRRMNKLLGPELYLDAKNSKDTNAAMLRWWSLLEKYSCKASKLHLKPRRFKMIVETLENQLLKDRKKTVRKRVSLGENSPENAQDNFVNQVKAFTRETAAVKSVLVDSQNIQKFGSGKGSSAKRQLSTGVNRGNYKPESCSMKTSKHRRKTVSVSTSAYKKWEKAAIAGVSLVAEAAEHLERTSTDKEVEHAQDSPEQDLNNCGCERDVPRLPNVQCPPKLKVQLFPIDESTRKALEMDKHNPHLELTLSTRKRISSVVEHLHKKWGASSMASGELMLLPYSVQMVNLVGCQRWTKDSTLTAADVYAQLGSPPVFRLRYGWFSGAEPESAPSQMPLSCHNIHNGSMGNICHHHATERVPVFHENNAFPSPNVALHQASTMNSEMIGCGSRDLFSAPLLSDKESEDLTVKKYDKNQNELRTDEDAVLSTREWSDSLTNISVGDLLSDESPDDVSSSINPSEPPRNPYFLDQLPFSCDSFDAAIAAHVYNNHSQIRSHTTLSSSNHISSSLWDAEETCDGFSFPKKTLLSEKESRNSLPSSSQDIAVTNTTTSDKEIEVPSDGQKHGLEFPLHEGFHDDHQVSKHIPDISMRDLNGLTDMYWPDSLGPLDLDIPSNRYRNDDLILSDSLSGLNRLIASSLDAFQNCSFFGLDKKESVTVEAAGETASVSDVKIDSKA